MRHSHHFNIYPVVNSLTHCEPEFTVETKPYLASPHLASLHTTTLLFSSISPPISAVDCWFCFVVVPEQQKVDEWELQPAFLFLHITRYRWSRKRLEAALCLLWIRYCFTVECFRPNHNKRSWCSLDVSWWITPSLTIKLNISLTESAKEVMRISF